MAPSTASPARALALLALAVAAPAAGAAGRATQPLAALHAPAVAYVAPSSSAAHVEEIAPTRPITRERTTLPIEATARRGGETWLQVMLPGRPNGRRGWIPAGSAAVVETPWRLRIDLGTRSLSVFREGQRVQIFRAVVGKPATPTPTGSFFVEETVLLPPGAAGGPYALALSARSDAYSEFDGGPGQIAIHGMSNLGGTLGEAQSHGCVRLSTGAITWLASRIGPGVPVEITA